MKRYVTKKFDMTDDDVLWEQFMCFARSIIPYEKHWHELTDAQKHPLAVFHL